MTDTQRNRAEECAEVLKQANQIGILRVSKAIHLTMERRAISSVG